MNNNDINTLREIIGGSKEYSFSGTVLTLTGYHTGETIKLDLSKINKEILNVIMAEDEDEDEDEDE